MAERGRRDESNSEKNYLNIEEAPIEVEAVKETMIEAAPVKEAPAPKPVVNQPKPERVRPVKESQPTRKPKKERVNTTEKRRKNLLIKGIAGGVAGAVVIGCGAYCVIDRMKDKDTMGCRLSVCGENVSWLPVEEAADKLQDTFQSTQVVFNEDGKDIYKVSLKDAGYSLNRDSLINELNKVKDNREDCKMLFEKPKAVTIDYQVQWDDDSVRNAFANDKMDNGSERVASKDAEIVFNNDTKHFEIAPSSLGTVIDNAKLMNRIQETLNNSFSKELLTKEIAVTIDTDMYKVPDVTEDQKTINKQLKKNNKHIDNYTTSTITYTFGDVTENISQDMIGEWIMIEDGEISLDDGAIRDYIGQLGADYNTQYIPREFKTSHGDTVVIENNEYGYWIDEDAEYEQLVQDIASGKNVTREPIYSAEGWKRNGNDDLVGGYVEVDLSSQHVWLYVDGEMVMETDCVTGQPTGGIDPVTGEPEDRSTYEGTYPISYKESPAVLSSDIYGYEQPVDYWMPFVYGQGLHDAGWRSGFGGNIYLWDGSHGCVNLPTYEASVIYSYVDENFPVILYKSGEDADISSYGGSFDPGVIINYDMYGNPIYSNSITYDMYGNPIYPNGTLDMAGGIAIDQYGTDMYGNAYGTDNLYDNTYGAADTYGTDMYGADTTDSIYGY